MCLLNELGIGGEKGNSWVCDSHVKTDSFGTTVWWRIPGLLGGTL